MKYVTLLCAFLLLTGCDTEMIPTIASTTTTPSYSATFTLKEGLELPSAPNTYDEIRNLLITMVEEDVMSMEIPYPVNLLELGMQESYALAFNTAYQHVNATHIELTSNTGIYYTGYRRDENGNFFFCFSREHSSYTQEEVLAQNQFFREEITRIFQELQDNGTFTRDLEPLEQVRVLFEFTTDYLSYDYGLEDISFLAYGAVTKRHVVCQGYVALLNGLLKEADFQAEGVMGHSTDNGEGHIWTRVLLDDTWHYFDPTYADRPTWTAEKGEVLYNDTYFDMSQDTMLYDRTATRYAVSDETLVLP